MRVDLQDRDRATVKTAIGFKHRDRHRIIAAKNKGHAAGVEQAGHRAANHRTIARGDFRRGIGHGVEIAEIGGDNTIRQDAIRRLYTEKVKIMLLEDGRPASRGTDRIRRVMTIGADGIGRCRPDPQHRDIDALRRVDIAARHVQPPTGSLAAKQVSHGRCVVHMSPPGTIRLRVITAGRRNSGRDMTGKAPTMTAIFGILRLEPVMLSHPCRWPFPCSIPASTE